MSSVFRTSLLSVVGLVAFAGCGEELSIPRTAPVSGSVTSKGKPAAGMRVKFHPQFDIGKVKFTPYGETGPEGKYVLNTGAPGNGAPVGDYIVTIEKPRVGTDEHGLESEVDDLKGKYSDPQKSQFKVSVKGGDNVIPPFDIE